MNLSFCVLQLLFLSLFGLLYAQHIIEIFIYVEILVIAIFLMIMEGIVVVDNAHLILGSCALSVLILCGAELALGLSFLMNCFKNQIPIDLRGLTDVYRGEK